MSLKNERLCQRIAIYWNNILGLNLRPEQVYAMLYMAKLVNNSSFDLSNLSSSVNLWTKEKQDSYHKLFQEKQKDGMSIEQAANEAFNVLLETVVREELIKINETQDDDLI